MDKTYYHIESTTGTSFAVNKDALTKIEKAIDDRAAKVTFIDYFGSECTIYRPHQTLASNWETSRETRRFSREHDQMIEKEKKEDCPSFD